MHRIPHATIFIRLDFNQFVFGGSPFTLQNIHHSITGNHLRLSLDVDAHTKDICYSFYLIRDGVTEKKVFYKKEPTIEFEFSPEGRYRVMWFIHLHDRKTTISDQYIVPF